MEVLKYLKRIHAVKKENPSLDYLTHLQEQHILNIHFENLDILNKRPISLDREDLFRKVVLFERGGVCYELNGREVIKENLDDHEIADRVNKYFQLNIHQV